MLQLVEFQPPNCESPEEQIRELHSFVTGDPESEVYVAEYVGSIAIVVRPGDTFESLCERYHEREQIDKERKLQYERRHGGDRRLCHRDDGQERRTA